MGWLTDFLSGAQKPTAQQGKLAEQRAEQSNTPVNTGRPVENPITPDALSNSVAKANKTGVIQGDFESNTVTSIALEQELASRRDLQSLQDADLSGMQAVRAAGKPASFSSADEFQIGPLRAAGTGTEEFDFAALIKQKVRTNPLDQYANYTYHIKFWMTSDNLAEGVSTTINKSEIDKIPKVVIAESGTTVGFNISEFTYRNLTGTTKETRNMPSISWTMKITEPYGFSLPDRLATASREIGVLNWQRGKYFIQLWFTGYHESGAAVSQALFHQAFRVSITNIDFNGNEGGGNYDIKGLFDGMTAFTNQMSFAQKNISISEKTVGGMLKQFQQKLNDNSIDLAYGTAPLEEYKINFPPEMENWAINTNRLSDDARSRNMNIKADGNQVTVTANPGVDFSNMIYRILSLTDEYLRWSQGTEGQVNSIGTLSHGLVKNVKIHARVEYIGYDTLAKDYVKRITYSLVPYYEVRVRGEDIPTLRTVEKKNVQQDKLRFLFAANRIRKKYEWIYTGQNLDIIKFEFKVNNFYVIASVPFSGTNIVSNQTQGPLSNEASSAWQERQGRYKTAKAKYDRLTTEISTAETELSQAKAKADYLLDQEKRRYTGVPQKLQEMTDQARQTSVAAEIKLATLRQEKQQALQNLVASRRDFVDFYDSAPSALVSNNPLAQQRRTAEAKFQSRYQDAIDKGQRDLFVEDQEVQELPDEPPYANTVRPDQEACIADFNQGAATRQTPGNADNKINYPRSRTLFGAVVGNLDSVNKEMINIELEIRGDPYWLGHSNIDVNNNVPSNLGELSEDYAEYIGGDNLFYLSFRSGQAPNENTGFMEFTTNNQFVDGFYSVVEVKNTFANGKFTQVLKSFKDTFSQTGNTVMDKYIKEAEQNQQLRALQSTPTPAVAPRTSQLPPQVDIMGNYTGF